MSTTTEKLGLKPSLLSDDQSVIAPFKLLSSLSSIETLAKSLPTQRSTRSESSTSDPLTKVRSILDLLIPTLHVTIVSHISLLHNLTNIDFKQPETHRFPPPVALALRRQTQAHL